MSESQEHRQQQARVLRIFRKVHRLCGAFLFIFFFFISVSGLLLGWKKHSGDLLLAKTRAGVSSQPADWLPIEVLHEKATRFLQDSVLSGLSAKVDRIDIRPDKGIAKILFKEHYTSLQIDCTTGKVLNVEKRWSDLIEHIHDGSVVDNEMGWGSGTFKLIYTTVTSLALLTFTITGFWLWYGPKVIRRRKKNTGRVDSNGTGQAGKKSKRSRPVIGTP